MIEVTFTRIARIHDIPPFQVDCDPEDPVFLDHVLAGITRIAGLRVARQYYVTIYENTDQPGTGTISIGWNRAGSGVWRVLEPVG